MLLTDKNKSAYEIDRAKYLRTQQQLDRAARAEAKTRRKMCARRAPGPR